MQVDMVLGDGARDQGARCDQIPESLPGVGYCRVDGIREPVRVREAWVGDHEIARTAKKYRAPLWAVPTAMETETVVSVIDRVDNKAVS